MAVRNCEMASALKLALQFLLTFALVIASSNPVRAATTGPFPLVTAEQYILESRYTADVSLTNSTSSDSNEQAKSGPVIVVEAPATLDNLASPFSLAVRFEPKGNARLDPTSLRIFYGRLRIDITDRVLEHLAMTGNRLVGDNLSLPLGKHRLTLEIADASGRKTRKLVKVTVASNKRRPG